MKSLSIGLGALAACIPLLVGPANRALAAGTGSASEPLPFIAAWGGEGSGEGQIQDALNLTVGPTGEVYVADLGNSRIQEFTATGTFVRMWDADSPWGIAAAPDGSIYVGTDFSIHKFSTTGMLQFSWGSFGGLGGQFAFLQDVAVDADGNVYSVELGNHRVQKFDSSGAFLQAWTMQGVGSGYPKGITVGADGYVYVSDSGNSTIQKFSREGNFIVAWALPDGVPGEGNRLGRPAVDGAGNVYVPDKFGDRIVVLDSGGTVQTTWGSHGTAPGQFWTPTCAAFGLDGDLYVMDFWNHRVEVFGLVPTAVAEERASPLSPALSQPVPSPMSTRMSVRFALPREGVAELSVFDTCGRLVARLLDGRQRAGLREVVWDGHDERGRPVASGVYFVRLVAGHSASRRFVVLR